MARGLTRFVGRDQELAVLTQALAQAAQGHGQLVALLGEAGVGKSRLVYELIHSHATQGWRVLEAPRWPGRSATPYFPVIDLLGRYRHIDDSDDARTMRAKVTGQVLTLDEMLQDTLPALLALLDVVPEDSPYLSSIHPNDADARSMPSSVLYARVKCSPCYSCSRICTGSTRRPRPCPAESLPTARLLLLVDYRPEYQHGWGSKTYYTQLRLDPMPLMSANEFLQALLGDDPSLEPLKQLLIARTEATLSSGGERPHAGGDRGLQQSAGPTIWQARRPSRCQPPYRPSWQRVSTACHPRRRASCRRLP